VEEFTCKKCGSCCKDLFDNRSNQKRGLTLTVSEAKLFPDTLIAPLAAFGKAAPENIFLYQLITNDCPYLNSKNQCDIYDKRPLVCKTFPLSQGSFSIKCRLFWFLKDFPENSVKVVIDWGKIQLEAEIQLDDYILSSFKTYFTQGVASWGFDLSDKKWVLIKRYNNIEEKLEF
jgi:Fe-S-cluster containining protein